MYHAIRSCLVCDLEMVSATLQGNTLQVEALTGRKVSWTLGVHVDRALNGSQQVPSAW